MAKTISESYLADNLERVLDGVEQRGESFQIERHGRVIAEIKSRDPLGGKTLDQILASIGDLRMPDPEFADLLEAIHRDQEPIGDPPEWP